MTQTMRSRSTSCTSDATSSACPRVSAWKRPSEQRDHGRAMIPSPTQRASSWNARRPRLFDRHRPGAASSHTTPKGAPSRARTQRVPLQRLERAVIHRHVLPPDQQRARRRRRAARSAARPRRRATRRRRRARRRGAGATAPAAAAASRTPRARSARSSSSVSGSASGPSNSSTRARSRRASSTSHGRSAASGCVARKSGSRAPTLRTDGCADGQAMR